MRRSEAIEIIKEILLDTNKVLIDEVTHFEYHAYEYANNDATEIIEKLEELGIIDSSQFGSTCSRCDRKSWDSEQQ